MWTSLVFGIVVFRKLMIKNRSLNSKPYDAHFGPLDHKANPLQFVTYFSDMLKVIHDTLPLIQWN